MFDNTRSNSSTTFAFCFVEFQNQYNRILASSAQIQVMQVRTTMMTSRGQIVNWIGTSRRHYQSSKMSNFQALTFSSLPRSYLQAACLVSSATRDQKAEVRAIDLVRECNALSFRPKKWAAESLEGRDSDHDGWMMEEAPTFHVNKNNQEQITRIIRAFFAGKGTAFYDDADRGCCPITTIVVDTMVTRM